jgi:death-on-curing protein
MRRTEPAWLPRIVVDAIHTDQVREHGGLLGLRDENALESALARPRHLWLYEDTSDLASLASAYAFGLARNHPYNDGNKRVALVAMLTFLAINHRDVDAADDDVLATMLDLAAGRTTEPELAAWIRARMVSASPLPD